jgi:hypothetical protein
MPDESGGFTVQEFTEACKRLDVPSRASNYRNSTSRAFLGRLCAGGLLEREGNRYYPTLDLCAILDVPPPLPRIPLPPSRGNDARAHEAWRIPLSRHRDTS